MNPDAALDFLEFVTERHNVWERRQNGLPAPWTNNPILASYKFTNVFRWADPGSQFLINELHNPDLDPRENLMRFFLYRHTGRVETWEYLQVMLGDYPTLDTLDEALKLLQEYRRSSKRPVFTGAYLVYPQSDTPGTDKLESIFALTQRLFGRGSSTAFDFLQSPTQAEKFNCLRRNKGVADFMSMQVLTDWGYTTEFLEDEFVVCGPGAVKGAKALGMAGPQALAWAHEAIHGLNIPPRIMGRLPSRMDSQNCLCEFSKYARYASGPIKVRYTPAHPGAQPKPTIPRMW